MKANTMKEAWEIAEKLFPYGYKLDAEASKKGFPIYRPVEKGHDGAYIKDYGDHLVVTLESARVTCIWVENERSVSPAYLAEKSVIVFLFDYYSDYETVLDSFKAAFPEMYIEGKIVEDDKRVPPAYHSNEAFMIYMEPFGESGRYVIRDMRRAAQ